MAALNHQVYPPILPGPEQGPFRADERRALSVTRGKRDSREVQRARTGLQDLAWMLSPAEAAVFAAWWASDLNYGTKWFIAVWPLPRGWGYAQRKMIQTPHWDHLGNGAWRVSVTCEVRMQPLERIYYTSRPYPIDPLELMEILAATPTTGYLVAWPHDEINIPPAFVQAGTLTSTLQTYGNHVPEQLDIPHSVPQSGTLVTVLVVYSNHVAEQFDIAAAVPQSGTLVETLVVYNNHVPEKIDIAAAVPVGGTLA